MRLKQLTAAAAVTAASTLLTLAAFYPRNLGADDADAAPPLQPEIARPVLRAGSVQLYLRPTAKNYLPGKKPVLELRAVNGADTSADIKVTVTMNAQDMPSPRSRSLPAQRRVWTKSCPISLAPNETRVIKLVTGAPVAPGQRISFNLTCGKQTVMAAWLTVPGRRGPTRRQPGPPPRRRARRR